MRKTLANKMQMNDGRFYDSDHCGYTDIQRKKVFKNFNNLFGKSNFFSIHGSFCG